MHACALPTMQVAGRHVTAHLLDLLRRRGYALNSSSDFDSIREAKEALCYTAVDYQKETQVRTAGIMHCYLMQVSQSGRALRCAAVVTLRLPSFVSFSSQ